MPRAPIALLHLHHERRLSWAVLIVFATYMTRAIGGQFPAGAPAALVFAHDPRVIMGTQTNRVCPLLQSHFRPTRDPSTLKRRRDDGEFEISIHC
jgi:hypothetical protein